MGAESKMLIAVTPAGPVSGESRKIEALLDNGWHRVHLRHPQSLRREVRDVIESVAPRLHSRLVLHGHFDLTCDFNLGGLHLNGRCPDAPALYNGPLSRSCHSVAEVLECRDMCYVTLSPVLDSVSKAGYRSPFTPADFMKLSVSEIPVIALGGITPLTLGQLSDYPFNGYAMLGAIPWEGSVEEVESFACQMKSLLSC